jgi:membrane protease subunit HflK
VRAAFNDVNRADQDRATYIQQAEAYASKVVPLARGAAARISADATGYQQQVVLTAQADIAKFEALLNVYKTSPDITRQRMFMDSMQTIFRNTSKVLVDLNASNNIIYLPLEKIIPSLQPSASISMATPVVNSAASSQEQTATAEVGS